MVLFCLCCVCNFFLSVPSVVGPIRSLLCGDNHISLFISPGTTFQNWLRNIRYMP